MNSHTINRDQKNGPGRAGAAHWGQSPVHIPAHGERGVGSPGIDATTVETGGGLTAPVLFHSSLLSRPSSSGFEHRRQVLGFPPLARGPVATFNSCAALLIGRSHQLNRISDKPGSDLAYPSHSFNASLVRWFNTDEPRTEAARKNGNPFQQKE